MENSCYLFFLMFFTFHLSLLECCFTSETIPIYRSYCQDTAYSYAHLSYYSCSVRFFMFRSFESKSQKLISNAEPRAVPIAVDLQRNLLITIKLKI